MQIEITEKTETVKQINNLGDLRKTLKEWAVYKVRCKITENNMEHDSFLFTGFKNGAYWELHNNSYDGVIPVNEKSIYSMKILEYLCDIK